MRLDVATCSLFCSLKDALSVAASGLIVFTTKSLPFGSHAPTVLGFHRLVGDGRSVATFLRVRVSHAPGDDQTTLCENTHGPQWRGFARPLPPSRLEWPGSSRRALCAPRLGAEHSINAPRLGRGLMAMALMVGRPSTTCSSAL